MEAGELVSDAIVSALIGERLRQLRLATALIFDGFPHQAPGRGAGNPAWRARPQA
jgi:adenylate kinase